MQTIGARLIARPCHRATQPRRRRSGGAFRSVVVRRQCPGGPKCLQWMLTFIDASGDCVYASSIQECSPWTAMVAALIAANQSREAASSDLFASCAAST